MNYTKDAPSLHATSVQSLQDSAENTFTKVTLREGLTEVPRALLRHSHSLRFLDLSNNDLTVLPDWIAELTNLEILFSSFNRLVTLPASLARLSCLYMVGARGNALEYVSEMGIPSSLRWLTLTDNQLESIPDSIAAASKIQKLLLAGNRLTSLPSTLSLCPNLELLRVSANKFHAIPDWILNHSTLAWVALAGNPVTTQVETYSERFPECRIDWSELSLYEELGRGASGITYRASRTAGNDTAQIAVKVFNSAVSSDGSADDELYGALQARSHQNLLTPLGFFDNHPEGRQGLVYTLLEKEYSPLAAPPSFATITRDVYQPQKGITPAQALTYAKDIVAATAHLHSKNLLHGDLYAHNTLVNSRQALLSDFGATLYIGNLDTHIQESLKKVELRSLGILLSELSYLLPLHQPNLTAPDNLIKETLQRVGEDLQRSTVHLRPPAEDLLQQLKKIA